MDESKYKCKRCKNKEVPFKQATLFYGMQKQECICKKCIKEMLNSLKEIVQIIMESEIGKEMENNG